MDALSWTTSEENDCQLSLLMAKEGWARGGTQPVLGMLAPDHSHLLAKYWAWNPSPTAAPHPPHIEKNLHDKAKVVVCLPFGWAEGGGRGMVAHAQSIVGPVHVPRGGRSIHIGGGVR